MAVEEPGWRNGGKSKGRRGEKSWGGGRHRALGERGWGCCLFRDLPCRVTVGCCTIWWGKGPRGPRESGEHESSYTAIL